MKITAVDPPTVHTNPAFAQAMVVDPPARMVFVGGQDAIDVAGNIVGDDVATQTAQALRNLLRVLEAAGARQEHVVKMTVHVVQGHAITEAFAAAQTVWGRHATAMTVLVVAGLANPRFLVEIDAIAAVPT